MAGQPKLKSSEVFERLTRLPPFAPVSELVVKGLKRDAEALLKPDPVSAYVVLGAIGAIEGNDTEMRKHFENAMRLAPNNVMVFSNYSASLARRRFHAEACAPARKAWELAPADVGVVDRLMSTLQWAGRIREAAGFLKHRQQLKPASPYEAEGFLMEADKLLNEHNVSDGAVEHLQELAMAVLREAGEQHVGGEFFMQQDEESRWISIWIRVPKTAERIVELNIELCDRIAAADSLLKVDRYVGYMYVGVPSS